MSTQEISQGKTLHETKMERRQIDCAICAETKDEAEYPSSRLTFGCLHPSSTCYDCVSATINTQFEANLSTRISCPECPRYLGLDEIRRFMTEENYSRYVNE